MFHTLSATRGLGVSIIHSCRMPGKEDLGQSSSACTQWRWFCWYRGLREAGEWRKYSTAQTLMQKRRNGESMQRNEDTSPATQDSSRCPQPRHGRCVTELISRMMGSWVKTTLRIFDYFYWSGELRLQEFHECNTALFKLFHSWTVYVNIWPWTPLLTDTSIIDSYEISSHLLCQHFCEIK